MRNIIILILCIFFILTLLGMYFMPAMAADGEPDSDQVITQPGLDDIIYFPNFPDEYNDFIAYPYRIVLQEKETEIYHLLLLTGKPSHVSYYDTLININFLGYPGPTRDGKEYTFDNSQLIKKWNYVNGFKSCEMQYFNIIYNNFTIYNNGGNGLNVYKEENKREFTTTTMALGNFQQVISKDIKYLVPFGVLILASFVAIKVIKKVFHIKDPAKVKNMRMRNKMFGRRY